MNKLRKIMYWISLPFIVMGLIFTVVIICKMLLTYNDGFTFDSISTLVIIGGIAFLIGGIAIGCLYPFVYKAEKQEYDDKTNLDFTNIDESKVMISSPVIGFDEVVKVQKDGILFMKVKKTIKYSDLNVSVIHKEFYGKKSNYFKIWVDTKKHNDFPRYFYLDYTKEMLYLFNKYSVEVSNLQALKETKKDVKKDKSPVLQKYHYSYKGLIFKIIISLVLVIAAVIIILKMENNYIAYFLMLFAILIWSSSKTVGVLLLTENGVILKKNFMRIEIPYDEIINININITDKRMIISSPFNFIEFEPIEEIANEIQKRVNYD